MKKIRTRSTTRSKWDEDAEMDVRSDKMRKMTRQGMKKKISEWEKSRESWNWAFSELLPFIFNENEIKQIYLCIHHILVNKRKESRIVLVTLELSDVVALLRRESRSLSCSGVDISSRISTAFDATRWNDSEMIVGWIPTGNRVDAWCVLSTNSFLPAFIMAGYSQIFCTAIFTGILRYVPRSGFIQKVECQIQEHSRTFLGGKHNFSRTFSARHPHILFTRLSTEPLRLAKQVAHISWCCKKCEQWLLIRKIGTPFERSMIRTLANLPRIQKLTILYP